MACYPFHLLDSISTVYLCFLAPLVFFPNLGFLFGGKVKSQSAAQGQQPVSKLSNAEISQRLRRATQIQCSESIINWTCPFISSGTAYDSGLIFSRGKGNKLHVYN